MENTISILADICGILGLIISIFAVSKGMEKERTQNFQNLITSMSDKFEQEHQIIFTTSMISDELNNKPYCVGEEYDRNNKTLKI